MNQVKKLLVILPLVALFVLGSLPVFAAPTPPAVGLDLTVNFKKADGTDAEEPPRHYEITKDMIASVDATSTLTVDKKIPEINKLAGIIRNFIEGTLRDGYKIDENELQIVVASAYAALSAQQAPNESVPVTVNLRLPQPSASDFEVIAYDIHLNRPQFTQMHTVRMDNHFNSTSDIATAYYNNSGLSSRFLLAGFARLNEDGTVEYKVTLPIASVEKVDVDELTASLRNTAQVAALVVPVVVPVKVCHTFPEGTRAELSEVVDVPYATWVTLQNSEGRLMDLPAIFRTRIQKVNEQGFAYRNIAYFNGLRPVTGLLASWNWAHRSLGGDSNDDWVARVYYDVAVAAAKEVPTEKKVDAATAPQAQIQAPAAQAQAQAPVVAANATTTTPVNTLPVTGASDSIFLFLSSAALMAVGILFFKKH